jgi:hypothetical protein
MSFRDELKEQLAQAKDMKDAAIRLAEHGCMCMGQAMGDYPGLSAERTGSYEWTLYGNTRGRWRRLVRVLPGPDATKSQARVISYSHHATSGSPVDCEGKGSVEYQIRKAIVAFLV